MNDRLPAVECISAITLVTADMPASFSFYRQLGFVPRYGGPDASFTSYHVGRGYLNVQVNPAWTPRAPVWGRVILYVPDVDAMHQRALAAGLAPSTAPADAPWGERYFHLLDPDGHELSFARPLEPQASL